MAQKNIADNNSAYFCTLTITGWIDLFTRKSLADIIIENLAFLILKKRIMIEAYCLMPSHLHLIAYSKEENLSRVLGHFKNYTAKELIDNIQHDPEESRKRWITSIFKYANQQKGFGREHKIWKSGCYPIILDSLDKFDQKMGYVHLNPVVAGFVTQPEHYFYSSAHPENPLRDLLSGDYSYK